MLALGDRFPMIRAHKVLAAYGCLAPRVVTGQFDPTRHRAIWPSTGNYCRGGVAISRILNSRGVAVLPEDMSQERFDWLDRWVADPADIVRTPGSESNVKEIYDACAALERDPANIVFNQFCEYGNYLVHRLCTGAALERVYRAVAAGRPRARLAAFVSATGSAGTIAAGDHLKATFGAKIAAVEAVECPTLLYNGYGEHNIQGIGDKHVPLIHNVMNTDVVIGVSDRATDTLLALFNTDEGRRYLVERRGVEPALVASLDNFGLSSICNIVAAVKLAKYFDLGPDDVVHHRRHRRRGDVRQRSAQGDRALTSAIASTRSAPARPGADRSPRRASTTCWNSATSTASGCSTSAISPGWSNRACRSRISRRGRARRSGTACSTSRRRGTL